MTPVRSSSTRPLVALRLADVELRDDPIRPEWILDGEPRARSTVWVTSTDTTTSSFVWDCTAGRFRWHFTEDETLHVIEGSVTVRVDGQEPVTLGAGDAALFRAGTWAEWRVDDYVRKHAVLRLPAPRPAVWLSLAARRLRRS